MEEIVQQAMNATITISDCLVILAIIISPLLAVRAQKIIESRTEAKRKKMKVFKTLMATRATPLSSEHIEALNMIDIEFYKDTEIKNAWKSLLGNFENYPNLEDIEPRNINKVLDDHAKKSNDLLAELLYQMSKTLGYKFDKVHIEQKCYRPKGQVYKEKQEYVLRSRLESILTGTESLPIHIVKRNKN